MYFPAAVDACRVFDGVALDRLAPGTVEIPADSAKPDETAVLPDDHSSGDHELTTCRRLFARDLGAGQPDLQDNRLVSVAVARFTPPDRVQAGMKATRLMTDALASHSSVRLVTGVGDEAGCAAQWAAVRSGNIVLGLAIADGGTEAALIPPAPVDDIQTALTEMTRTLEREYKG